MMVAPRLLIPFQDRELNLLDARSAGLVLAQVLPGLAGHAVIDNVLVERCWPVGSGTPAGFNLEWSFPWKGRRHSVYGEWGTRRKSAHEESGQETSCGKASITVDGVRGLCRHLEGTSLVLRSPDQDRLLPQLSVCLSSKAMNRRLKAFGLESSLRDCPTSGRLRCRLGGYRPGRRATLRFRKDAAGKHLCGKTFRDDRGRGLIDRHLQVSDALRRRCGGRVVVPSPVGFDQELNMALFIWMPGIQAEQVENEWGLIDAAIEGLCLIHQLPGDGAPFSALNELEVVQRWRQTIGLLAPTLADEAGKLSRKIEDAAARLTPVEPVTIHRDFYEKQIILSPTQITILDLDTMTTGDGCVDLGNFLAHLYLRELGEKRVAGSFSRLARHFLRGYQRQHGHVPVSNLGFYTASSLFRLGAVHALRTRTARYRRALWQMADKLLTGEGFAKCVKDTEVETIDHTVIAK